jgi:RNA polymerase sigma-B factor
MVVLPVVEMDLESPEFRHVGELLARVRDVYGLTQREMGAALDRSSNTIRDYEFGRRKPPPIFIYDLLDSLPVAGLGFNDIADRFDYRPIESFDPNRYGSIHAYVAGVRILRGHSRASFAATVGCGPDTVRRCEHRDKPDELFLRRLVRRHLRSKVSYADLVRRFRTLRPDPTDLRLRARFGELRGLPARSPGRERLRDELIKENLDLAHSLARRYGAGRGQRDDLAQVGAEALVHAVDGCDPRYGDFIPYLRKWVRGSVSQWARQQWLTGTAADVSPHGTRVVEARDELEQALRREPSPTEIAAHLGLSLEVVDRVLRALRSRYCGALDERGGGGAVNVISIDASPARADLSDPLKAALDALDPQARNVVAMRYVNDLDDDVIAARLGLSVQRVRYLVDIALHRLNSHLSQDGDLAA